MTTYDAFIQRIASYRTLIVFAILFGLFGGLVMPAVGEMINERAGQAVSILDIQSGLYPSEVYGLVASYGDAGRSLYRIVQLTVDIVYPVVYTLFLAIALFLFYKAPGASGQGRQLHRLPLLLMALDYTENLLVVAILSLYPTEVPALAYLCSGATFLKWSVFVALVVLVLVGLVRHLAGRRQRG